VLPQLANSECLAEAFAPEGRLGGGPTTSRPCTFLPPRGRELDPGLAWPAEVQGMGDRRVAVITGAANGIGRATALELGRAGYALVLCDLDGAELERSASTAGAELARVVDVSRADQVAELAEACRERFGRADVLVNNAGILRLGAWLDLGEADWRKLFEVNLLGVTLVTRAFLPLLTASRGHVVNLGSGSSLLPFAGYAAYGPVKVGVLWLSEYLRAELAPRGVRVSCVCPLLVRTRMGAAGQADVTRQPDWLFHPPEHIAGLIRRTIGSRRFLVYGSFVLHALHLLYRWSPAAARALLTSVTRSQLRARATSGQRSA
jgi:NAD(P)-dependent dehydrogenase (short-subunit alcohol dehydrogenase family)